MSQLTYIFGAGASAGKCNDKNERLTGMPVISQMKDALDAEIVKLESFTNPLGDFDSGEWNLNIIECTEGELAGCE